MSQEERKETLEDNIATHVFSASALLAGVCLTVIGIFRIGSRLKHIAALGEELLAFDAAAFLIACTLSYLALRTKDRERKRTVEKVADFIFLVALCALSFICGMITYQFI